jgi:protein gp37
MIAAAAGIPWLDPPQRSPEPTMSNVWVGVSVTSDETLWRVEWLLKTKTYGRTIISFEPLLGPIDARSLLGEHFDLAIIGGESGRNHRLCEVEWIRSLVEQAHAAGVSAFCKQDCGLKPGQQGRIPDELWNVKEVPKP